MRFLKTSIIVCLLIIIGTAIKVVAYDDVGIHVEFSEIKDTFHRHLVKYVGDCPGETWSGLAADGDLRFISYNTEPNKRLEVNLINLRTGKKITRDYKKVQLGSNDFNLRQLGNEDGEHNVEYQIYNKDTKQTIESGNFTYTITTSEEIKQRNANWKLELFCAQDGNRKIRYCDTVGKREIKYCQGRKTGETRNQGIINLDQNLVRIDLYSN
ncbi:MAG: hypothetical protein QNJ32_02970 [Xenococcaceae cyanobacterium MO_167.B27]|nr:hypothetical protein [Xenococcaceae cyanobacterium MO_167.B27]